MTLRRERAAVYAALGDEHRLGIMEALLLTDLTSMELARRVEMPSNLLAHHLAVLEDAGLVRRRRSDGDGRRRYISVRTEHLPLELAAPSPTSGGVLFACSRNSARSQLAAALYTRRTGRPAESAGVDPGDAIHPKAAAVASEIGIHLAGSPKGYEVVSSPDVVVSVCDLAGEQAVPFDALRLHWSLPDPVSDGRIGAFRRARDVLDERVGRLAAAMA